MRPQLLVAGALLLVSLAACSSGDGEVPAGALPPSDADRSGDRLEVVRVADLGDTVTALTAAPDGDVAFVARRSGAIFRLRYVEDGDHLVPVLDPEPVLDLAGTVTTDGERGLLDLLFAPDGESVYASYTDPNGAVTLARFPADPSAGTLDAEDPAVVARVEHPYAGHNGGDLEWLDDDTLLWSLGDIDLTTVDPPAAQDPSTPLGTVVGIDVRDLGDQTLEATDLVGDRQLALGLRNPWRIEVDHGADRLLIADVGDDRSEEVDAVALDELGGEDPPNFGWPYVEGDEPSPRAGEFVAPVLARSHGESVCAIAGGVTVPEGLAPDLAGRFLLGDNCSGEVLALDVDAGEARTVAEVDDGLVALADGGHDDVYALGIGGGLWRLDPPGWRVDAPEPVDLPPPPPPAEGEAEAPDLPADEFQAVCDVRRAFDLLSEVPGAPPDRFEALVGQATTTFEDAVGDLPEAVDPTTFQELFARVAGVGETTGWDTSSPAFQQLFQATTDARPPFQDFPEAMALLVDLGAACS